MNHLYFIRRSLSVAFMLVLFAGWFAPWAQAKSNKKKDAPKEPGIYVISHLELPEVVSNIQASDDLGSYTIELIGAEGRKVTLVNVNNPEKPKLVGQVPVPPGLEHSSALVRAGNTRLSSATEEPSGKADPQLIALISFSDPAEPKTIQQFSGVTAIWIDETRELVYIADTSGLWILRIYPPVDENTQPMG